MQHLVLINDNAVRLFQNVLERGMGYFTFTRPCFRVNKGADVVHGPGRYRATMAARSRKFVGFSSLM